MCEIQHYEIPLLKSENPKQTVFSIGSSGKGLKLSLLIDITGIRRITKFQLGGWNKVNLVTCWTYNYASRKGLPKSVRIPRKQTVFTSFSGRRIDISLLLLDITGYRTSWRTSTVQIYIYIYIYIIIVLFGYTSSATEGISYAKFWWRVVVL